MENLELMFRGAYRGRRVLVTGHTGFKGSWLALWLTRLGASVTGLSLEPPTQPNHWDLLGLRVDDRRFDIRDPAHVRAEMERCRPEIVFHLAAQSLVRASYADPIVSWATNVMGTVHVLDASRHVSGIRAVVCVTTDKCYENTETLKPYREDDALGGHDAYSASKAGAELAAASYRRAFMAPAKGPLVATARAGNVIGGGDWSPGRLVPDAVRACGNGDVLQVRSPRAVRPWQHVLEPLAGYLLLGQRLLEGDQGTARAWNFGPREHDCLRVEQLLCTLQATWPAVNWEADTSAQPHEAGLLRLDSSLARKELRWQGIWDVQHAVSLTARWYMAWLDKGELCSERDLDEFAADAQRQGMSWAQ
jgi:CDP-glucose 4,6-dehydratase